jgi:hypothetical protein
MAWRRPARPVHPSRRQFIRRKRRFVAGPWHRRARLPKVQTSQDKTHKKEPHMNTRLDTLIQRTSAFVLAALVTAATMASLNGLAGHEIAADSLLAQFQTSQRSS